MVATAVTFSEVLTTVTELFTWVMDTITGNQYLLIAFIIGVLIPPAVMVFKRLIHTV